MLTLSKHRIILNQKDSIMAIQQITTHNLRLRSTPEILPANIITTLPAGTLVSETEEMNAGWVKVNVHLSGKDLTGYVSKAYLAPDTEHPVLGTIAQVDLPVHGTNAGSRSSADYRAYPLHEANMPGRDETADSQTKIGQIYKILDYLDVPHSLRYKPGNGVTYCNIYAYDFATLSKTYIPRVWWTSRAIMQLSKGIPQQIRYGDTVEELNANSLFDWFRDFGNDFGWTRIFDVNQLQAEVNTGKIGAIVGQRTILSRSGHIDIVIPEYESFSALRSNGKVAAPLQSQAGVVNKKIFTSQWFLSANFRQYGFWLHS